MMTPPAPSTQDDVDCLMLLIQWNLTTAQLNYRLVAATTNQQLRERLEQAVATAVAELQVPETARDRINAISYVWFNDGTLVGRVRNIADNQWRAIANGDLSTAITQQLAALLASLQSSPE